MHGFAGPLVRSPAGRRARPGSEGAPGVAAPRRRSRRGACQRPRPRPRLPARATSSCVSTGATPGTASFVALGRWRGLARVDRGMGAAPKEDWTTTCKTMPGDREAGAQGRRGAPQLPTLDRAAALPARGGRGGHLRGPHRLRGRLGGQQLRRGDPAPARGRGGRGPPPGLRGRRRAAGGRGGNGNGGGAGNRGARRGARGLREGARGRAARPALHLRQLRGGPAQRAGRGRRPPRRRGAGGLQPALLLRRRGAGARPT